MNIFALHDAALVARLAGADRPLCSGLALSKDDPSNVLFSFVDENPLAPGWLCDLELPGDCIASWSGTLAFGEDERFAAHPHNWMSPGSEALDRLLGEIEVPIAKSGKRFCLIPHARHVLSDVQGCVNLARRLRDSNSPIEVALAPGAMLTPSMLGQQDEHLERAFDTLAEFAPFLYLYDVAVDDSGENLLPVPLGEGELDGEIVRQLIQSAWPSNKPIVLRSQRLAEQCTWLAGDV